MASFPHDNAPPLRPRGYTEVVALPPLHQKNILHYGLMSLLLFGFVGAFQPISLRPSLSGLAALQRAFSKDDSKNYSVYFEGLLAFTFRNFA